MMSARSVIAFGSLALLTACQEEIVSGVAEDAGSVTQFEVTRWSPAAATIWTLLVVDDAPTEAARSMRALLAADLHGFFDYVEGCGTSSDPASYRPIDQRLIVVGSSGTLEPRFRDEEGLHAFGVDASPELLLAYEEAGEAAILGMETTEVLPFTGVAELAHYVNLIEGTVAPRSPGEEEIVRLLPETLMWPWAALARTRPDLSPEHPPVTSASWSLRLLHWPEDGSCPPFPRGEVDIPSLEPLQAQRTSPACFEEATVFTPSYLAGKYTCACLPWAPPADAAGRVSCRVYGEFPADADCGAVPGWTFLDSTTSKLSGDDTRPVHLCELRQAEGVALDACIHDFACEGCEPSFCFRRAFTEADNEDPAHLRRVPAADPLVCDASGEPLILDRLRFVLGADQIGGPMRVVCQK
jgi:hypothetical protein